MKPFIKGDFLTLYYLNFERTGWNPLRDKIIAIAFHEVEKETGQPIGELKILSEWNSSEIIILSEFYDLLDPENHWNFVPIGFDLHSDFRFLRIRMKEVIKRDLQIEFLYEKLPLIDLLPIAILMNKGRFKGTTMSWTLGFSKLVPVNRWFQNREYNRLYESIHVKCYRFLQFFQYLRQELPLVWARFTPKS